MRCRLGGFLFLFILVAIPCWGFEFQATVTQVLAGDKLEVLNLGNFYKIRLAFVRAPENGQDFSKQAKEFSENLIAAKQVRIVTHGQTESGWLLGEVFLGDKNLGRELLENGLAWEYPQVKKSEFAKLQAKAEEQKKGLWSEKDPTPPWKFKEPKKKTAKSF